MAPPDHKPDCTKVLTAKIDETCVGCVWMNAVHNLIFLYDANKRAVAERKRGENYGKN